MRGLQIADFRFRTPDPIDEKLELRETQSQNEKAEIFFYQPLEILFLPDELIPRPLLLKREGAKILQIGEVPLFPRASMNFIHTQSAAAEI